MSSAFYLYPTVRRNPRRMVYQRKANERRNGASSGSLARLTLHRFLRVQRKSRSGKAGMSSHNDDKGGKLIDT